MAQPGSAESYVRPDPERGRRAFATAALGTVLIALRNRLRRPDADDRQRSVRPGGPGVPESRKDGAEGGHVHRSRAQEGGRGRGADTPSEIPARGWRDIAFRVKDEIGQDNISVAAAGVAFYTLLAIVPALGALVSVYGLAADISDVENQIVAIAGMLPQEALELLREQLHRVVSTADTSLSFGAIFGLLLTIWSATKGVGALFTALNIAYDEDEKRSFLRLTLVTLGFTVGGIVAVLVILALVVGVPAVTEALGLWGPLAWAISIARWPLLGIMLVLAMALLYRHGPSRDEPKWRWVSWGAAFATVVWILGSLAFSFYVSNFGSYNETYGSLGAVVILMMWFWLSAYIVLIGAEINAEMEHQTAKDTTEGHPQPMGARRARMADTLGETR